MISKNPIQTLHSSLVFLLFLSAVTLAEESSRFQDLLIKEVENRATARVLMSKMSNARQMHPDSVFWNAYKRLEELNYQEYGKIAARLNVSMEAGVKSRLLAAISSVALRVTPQLTLKAVHNSTRTYVGQLETLYRLSPTAHKDFFDYVVRQEKAQLIAMKHAANKDYELAAEVIETFVSLNMER